MNYIIKAIILLAIISTNATAQNILTGTPSSDVLLTDDCYILDDCYIIESGRTLEIQAGVTIQATQDAVLIVEPGGRIEASGTANNPIVFTTVQTPGSRTPGYWYGLEIAGDAPVNNGLIDLHTCSNQQAGGLVSNDNSGWLEYVQIHFAGKADPANDERIEAGLSLLAVGNATEILNVQVSNSATNGINIAGGTVDAKFTYLLDNFRNDLFITDGYTGNLQGFYTERRNVNAHHSDGSHGIVIQNNILGDTSMPHTRPVISNFTINGPLHCAGSAHADFENALQLQNNARADIWNSFFGYYRLNGVHIEDQQSIENTDADELNISRCTFTDNGSDYSHSFSPWSGNGCSGTMAGWIETMTAGCSEANNQFDPIDPAYNASFCGDYCDAQFVPNFVLDDANTELDPPSYSSLSGFFTTLAFRGAIQDSLTFETPSIDVCPLETVYCSEMAAKDEFEKVLYLYPNPAKSYTDLRFESPISGTATILVMDKVTGRIWQQIEVQMEQPGQQEFRVPVRGLPENVYILQVNTAAETLHGQLLIQ